MFSGLFRSAISRNSVRLWSSFQSIDTLINSIADKSEGEINNSLVAAIGSYRQSLGTMSFKGRFFEAMISTETAKSHGHVCQMSLPLQKKGTELGDIIVAVDYILVDDFEHTTKIVNGCASVLQTKKEVYARKGLDSAQLYLMTQWPELDYHAKTWKFDVFSDCFAFYFFVLDPANPERTKSSILSAPMLTKYLNANKASLLAGINQSVPFSNLDLLVKEKVGISTMPFSFSSYLMRGLYLTVGSPSITFRAFLKNNFFASMEEVEDCDLINPTNKLQVTSNEGDWNNKQVIDDGEDEDISAIRLKLTLKRIEK